MFALILHLLAMPIAIAQVAMIHVCRDDSSSARHFAANQFRLELFPLRDVLHLFRNDALRARCICETFRLPFACPVTGRHRQTRFSLFNPAVTQCIEPLRHPDACSATLNESFESRIHTTRWNYGTGDGCRNLRPIRETSAPMLKLYLTHSETKAKICAPISTGLGALYGCAPGLADQAAKTRLPSTTASLYEALHRYWATKPSAPARRPSSAASPQAATPASSCLPAEANRSATNFPPCSTPAPPS